MERKLRITSDHRMVWRLSALEIHRTSNDIMQAGWGNIDSSVTLDSLKKKGPLDRRSKEPFFADRA